MVIMFWYQLSCVSMLTSQVNGVQIHVLSVLCTSVQRVPLLLFMLIIGCSD